MSDLKLGPSYIALIAACEMMICHFHHEKHKDSDEPISYSTIVGMFAFLAEQLCETFGDEALMDFVYDFADANEDFQFDLDALMMDVINGKSGLAIETICKMKGEAQ